MPVQRLIESLFRVCLARPETTELELVRGDLEGVTFEQWTQTLSTLKHHRVLPLVHYQLSRLGLLSALPTPIRDDLELAYQQVRGLNMKLILSMATLLRAFSQRGEMPLVMKGVVLADGYYADFGVRPMGDIDLVASPGQDEVMLAVLKELGYTPTSALPEEDAVVLESKSGIVCDAHRRLRLFEGEPWDEVTREVELSRLRGVTVRVFEPHAMVAHAVAHMTGHLRNLGPILLWVIDLTLMFRRHAHELDLARIEHLLPDPKMRTLFLRVLSLLSAHEELPPAFREACRHVPALSLAVILRQRRLTPWGLPAPIGWVRLCAHQLSLHHYERYDVPELQDLMLWPIDVLANRLLPRIVGRSFA